MAICTTDRREVDDWMNINRGVYDGNGSKSYTDPIQGCVDDCFFIAALSSVAWAANTKLNTHPTYKFYDAVTKAWTNSFTTNDVLAVDTTDNLVFARCSRPYSWPCLYEKAFAKWNYNKNPHSDTPDIKTILSGGNGLTALLNICGGTLKTQEMKFNPASGNRTTNPTVAKTKAGAGAGLTSNHTYSVLKKTTSGYQLRNPCSGLPVDVTTADFNANFTEWGYVIPG